MTKHTIDIDRRYGIGPMTNTYGHPAVTTFNVPDEEGMPEVEFYACLDCGYVTTDIRRFQHEDCELLTLPGNDAPINTSWRTKIRDDGYPDHPDLG